MLLIKLTAEDLRIIKGAKTDQEKLGLVDIIKDRIEQSEVLKSLGHTPKLKNNDVYVWQTALKKCKEQLGEDVVTMPPFPDYRWYQRINTMLRDYGFTDEYVTKLCDYARLNLFSKRKTISFDFLICQHLRILNGEFDAGATHYNRGVPSSTPDLATHKLPEE